MGRNIWSRRRSSNWIGACEETALTHLAVTRMRVAVTHRVSYRPRIRSRQGPRKRKRRRLRQQDSSTVSVQIGQGTIFCGPETRLVYLTCKAAHKHLTPQILILVHNHILDT